MCCLVPPFLSLKLSFPVSASHLSFFLAQDDIVMGTLSVRENLYFSAALRLPFDVPWKEKRRRVNKLIDELGLTDCAGTKVRVISG